MNLLRYLDDFSSKRILVVGDVMLDKYIFGRVHRISPEAPVPIVVVENEKYVPGGAANAANNIASMGAKAFLLGIVGDDSARDTLIRESQKRAIDTGHLIVSGKKPTTQKIRTIGNKHQLLRIDYENKEEIDDDVARLARKLDRIDRIDAVIVSDYAKGTVTRRLMTAVKAYARDNDLLLLVDPKPCHKALYRGVSLVTPNRREAEEMSGIPIESESDLERAGKAIIDDLGCNVLITRGEEGISLFEGDRIPVHIPTVAREVYDVSGAGDTVIAALALALSAGATLAEATELANHAGGIKVAKLGTSPVLNNELKSHLLSLQ